MANEKRCKNCHKKIEKKEIYSVVEKDGIYCVKCFYALFETECIGES